VPIDLRLLRLTVADNSPRIAPDRRVVDVVELRRFVAGRHWRRRALARAHIDAEKSSRLGCARCRARIHLDQTPDVVPVVDPQTGLASWLPRRGVGRSAIVISRWAPPASRRLVEVPAGHLLDEPIAVTRVGGHLLMRGLNTS